MGLAIGMLSLSVRLALLPLTLWIARRSLEAQAALKKLEPQISSIRKKHKDDPQRMWEETAILHRQHGIKLMEGKTLLSSLVQIPLFFGLFAAVRRGLSSTGGFLWVKDLMQSDPLLACLCALLTGVSAFLAPTVPESQRTASIVLPAALTLVFLWRISAGVAIYSFSSSMVGVVQSLLIRRHAANRL
jgi:YidC/Oxa1 family membrane protein insertase